MKYPYNVDKFVDIVGFAILFKPHHNGYSIIEQVRLNLYWNVMITKPRHLDFFYLYKYCSIFLFLRYIRMATMERTPTDKSKIEGKKIIWVMGKFYKIWYHIEQDWTICFHHNIFLHNQTWILFVLRWTRKRKRDPMRKAIT